MPLEQLGNTLESNRQKPFDIAPREGVSYIWEPAVKESYDLDENNFWRTPYSISEIVRIRKKIDSLIVSNEFLASQQSKSLLQELYKKTSFTMAFLTLLRSKPIPAIKGTGYLLISISLIAGLLNFIFSKCLISPYIILYFFYFGFFISLMAIIEHRIEIKKRNK